MGQAGSNHESNRVDRAEQGRITKSQHVCFGSSKVAQIFPSHKVATYLIWVAQSSNISCLGCKKSLKVSSVAQSRSILIWSRNGCNIQHTQFESSWSQDTHFESKWSQHKSAISTQVPPPKIELYQVLQ